MLAAGRSPAAAEACRIVLGGSLLGFVFAWLLLARGVGRRTISLRSLPCHPEKDATAPLPLCPEKERKEIKEVEDPTAFLLSEPKLRSVIEQRQKRMEQNDLEIQARAEEDRKAKVQQAAEELRKKQAERKAQEKLLKWEKEQLAKREGMSTVAPEVGGTQVHPLVPSVGEAGGTQLHPLVPIPAEAGGNRAYGEHMIAMNPEKEYQREAEKLEKLRLQEVEQRKRLEEQEEQEDQEEESEKKEEEDEQDEGKGKKAENGEEGGGSRVWWVLLLIAVAYAACLAAVLQLPTSTGGLAFLAADRGGAALLVAVAVVTAGLSASGLAVEAKRLAAARPGVGVVLAAVGGALWLAGLLQLSLDLGLQTLPTPLGAVVRGFESYRAVHSLSARRVGEAVPCPHAGGRADITFQGAFDPTTLGRPSAGAVYLDLSSRFLPAKEESRPVWLQPYTPRLDQELWRFAQLPRNQSKALPKWALRLLRGLYLRQGGAARLSNGAWRGPAAALHGGLNTDYAKVTPPLLAVRAVWRRSSMVADVHSNKWWNRTEVRIMKELVGEDAEAAMKPLKPRCEVAPALLAEAPLVEAMLALIAAVFLWKLLMSGSA
mmetsp:Transcript_100678/g.280392  ORF Transcript_100678/g.280392 Transcript_100678/m.280392 type:complete len:601 (-) Transcript_100678:91-1893(-)